MAGQSQPAASFTLGDHAQCGHELAGDDTVLGREPVDDVETAGDPLGRVDDHGEDGDPARDLEQPVTMRGPVTVESPDAADHRCPTCPARPQVADDGPV